MHGFFNAVKTTCFPYCQGSSPLTSMNGNELRGMDGSEQPLECVLQRPQCNSVHDMPLITFHNNLFSPTLPPHITNPSLKSPYGN